MSNCVKRPYPTPRAALQALHAIRRKHRYASGDGPNAIHPCGICHAWHVTRHPPTGWVAHRIKIR